LPGLLLATGGSGFLLENGMMRRLPILAAMAFLMSPGAAAAQERSIANDLEYIARDAWFIVRSPARATSDDWSTTGLIAAGTGLLLFADEPIHDWLRDNPDSFIVRALAPFGEPHPLNLLGRTRQFLVPFSVALWGAGLAFDDDNLRDAGLGCATSNLTTTLSRSAVSMVLGRLRPEFGGGAFVFELFGGAGTWDMRSFPGGHGANVFSCASYFNHRFDLGAAEPVIWTAAGAVAAARLVNEAHWTSDAVAGAAWGYAVGRGVAYRFREREAEREAERSLQPSLSIGWRIRF
jgi:membrane-associated phospholipid phosphatase